MIDFYELSVGSSKRVLESTIGVMEKGAKFFEEQGIESAEIVEMRLAPDMLPFSFQVNSVRHNTLGLAKGLMAGQFSPPPAVPELSYRGLIDFLKDALAELDAIDAKAIAATSGKAITFKAPSFELPFTTTENFVVSFALPNLYFHATTLYDMLRIKGVPLGKMDFLGNMNVGQPEA